MAQMTATPATASVKLRRRVCRRCGARTETIEVTQQGLFELIREWFGDDQAEEIAHEVFAEAIEVRRILNTADAQRYRAKRKSRLITRQPAASGRDSSPTAAAQADSSGLCGLAVNDLAHQSRAAPSPLDPSPAAGLPSTTYRRRPCHRTLGRSGGRRAGAERGAARRDDPQDPCREFGRIVLATLLAEAWHALPRRDDHALRCLCGVAPVTKRSGKSRIVIRRQAAHRRLANAVDHFCAGRRAARPEKSGQIRRAARPRSRPRSCPALGWRSPARRRLRHA